MCGVYSILVFDSNTLKSKELKMSGLVKIAFVMMVACMAAYAENHIDVAVRLIKEFEGFRANAYLCPAGKWTIGYGQVVGKKDVAAVTKEQAEAWLREEAKKIDEFLAFELPSVRMSDTRRGALISFVYNVGRTAFKHSTLKKRLLAGDSDLEIAEAWRMWKKITVDGKKQTSKGLVKRRALEIGAYLKG